jgi:hypothetical protein
MLMQSTHRAAMHAGMAATLGALLAGCAAAQRQADAGFTTTVVEARPSAAEAPSYKPATRVAGYAARQKVAATTPPPRPTTSAGAGEADCAAIDGCATVLKAMVGDKSRAWIRHPAGPAALASGVRLFAYRALRDALTCEELTWARAEVEAAARTFNGAVPGFSEAQILRVHDLSVEVRAELRGEDERRCRKPAPEGAPRPKEGPVGTIGRATAS